MIQIESLEVNKYVTFEKAKLKLTPGITVIRGRNLDRKNGKPNRAGKSLLVSAIPTILYNAPPTSVKKKSAKDVHEKGTSLTLNTKIGSVKWGITQFQKGKSVGYDLSKDGVAQKFRTQADAYSKLKNLIPMSEDFHYSLVYLDARNPNILQRGTAEQRTAFFERIFDLDLYDNIYKSINKKTREINFGVLKIKELQAQQNFKQSQSPDLPLPKLETLYFSMSNFVFSIRP